MPKRAAHEISQAMKSHEEICEISEVEACRKPELETIADGRSEESASSEPSESSTLSCARRVWRH